MTHLSPSLLAADFAHLGDSIDLVRKGGADYIHVDIMDGLFVPSISMGLPVLKSVDKYTDMFLDVHLMIIDPDRYIEEFAKAGADLITFHFEATKNVDATIDKIRGLGLKVGMAISPSTESEVVLPYLEKLDMVLVMTVNPGFGNQAFIEHCGDKVHAVSSWIKERGLEVDVQVDGGIKASNLEMILDKGANVIVAGSAIFGGDIYANTENFVKIMEKYN